MAMPRMLSAGMGAGASRGTGQASPQGTPSSTSTARGAKRSGGCSTQWLSSCASGDEKS